MEANLTIPVDGAELQVKTIKVALKRLKCFVFFLILFFFFSSGSVPQASAGTVEICPSHLAVRATDRLLQMFILKSRLVLEDRCK